jgi:hypothetical protein
VHFLLAKKIQEIDAKKIKQKKRKKREKKAN